MFLFQDSYASDGVQSGDFIHQPTRFRLESVSNKYIRVLYCDKENSEIKDFEE